MLHRAYDNVILHLAEFGRQVYFLSFTELVHSIEKLSEIKLLLELKEQYYYKMLEYLITQTACNQC